MKKLLLSTLLAVASIATFAQTGFMHNVGAGYIVRVYKMDTGFGDVSSSVGAPAVSYSPRYNFWGNDNMTISAGSHIDLGFAFNTGTTGSSGYFFVGIPLVAEVNFGRGSSVDNESKIGGFAGAGFEYMLAAGGGTEHIYGPTAQAGITFPAGDRTLGVRLSYLKEIQGVKSNLIGAGVFFVL